MRLTDERRFDVPIVLVCPEFTPAQAKEWIAAGESRELARAAHLEYMDLGSGHWPMATRPGELARVLARPRTRDAVAGLAGQTATGSGLPPQRLLFSLRARTRFS
ncbi:hypothetical protein GCM10010358_82180 [Streptomyces minutiscleroticus]|uniref:Esterase n=1 Tax=Streptomyces minutiscleroticus TaxID=68238 RepID=A0A918UAF8_9ACTN|nr:hypothetical protein GCM10010358_82180 [Streptomyces minutiscleroticus]